MRKSDRIEFLRNKINEYRKELETLENEAAGDPVERANALRRSAMKEKKFETR